MTQLATCSWKEFRPEMGHPVSISRGGPRARPRWAVHVDSHPGNPGYPAQDKIWSLCPSAENFRITHIPTFEVEYAKQLDHIGVDAIQALLYQASKDIGGNAGYAEPLVLLCFEQDVTALHGCHRRRFAAWWYERTGQWIPELGGRHAASTLRPPSDTPSAVPENAQPELG